MSHSARGLGHRLARSPGAQLVLCGAVLALAFPGDVAGAVGVMILAAALGIGAVLLWPRAPAWLRRPPVDVTTAIVVTVVATAGVVVFWDALVTSPDWPIGDWGPQHAVLAQVVPHMPGLDLPVWTHLLSTGDAPLELYPSLAYVVTGHLAVVLGLEHDLAHALLIVAVIVHVGIAVGTTLIAARIAPRPLALLVGVVALVDTGAVAHGGTVGLFRWGLLHGALSLAFATVAALGVVDALRRPRLATSVLIWVATALAVIAHPAGLIGAAASIVALGAVALLASDVPPRRALVAIGHVTVGIALGAAVWMPLAQRILLYGQHFPNPVRSAARVLEDLLAAPSPVTAYALIGYAGYLGIVAGLWSRKAPIVFVAATALVLLLGLSDAAYLGFDLAPGHGIARLGTERLAQLARPCVLACAAYGLWVVIGAVLATWRTAARRQQLVAVAVIAVMTGAALRTLPTLWWSAAGRAAGPAALSAPDPEGRAHLTAWAHAQAAGLRPDAWGRALFEQDTHEQMHLTAATGLPTLHPQWLPDLLLRERFEDTSPASLRRFNVRWVVGVGESPRLGDPATERVFGSYHVRELAAWDGQFARIERGPAGATVRTLRLDADVVEVEVAGTTEPVLVALGTGYYPRWRAHHASGAAEPVYAWPGIEGGRLHVVSAWLAPGRTTFTVDGPLPSDGAGRGLSLLAAIGALAAIVTWRVRRLRLRVLRRLAHLRARALRLAPLALRIGVPLVIAGLLVRGCLATTGVTRSLELGTGVRATATVEARRGDDPWERCGYAALTGTHECAGLLSATDGIASLLNDAPPSWGFNTPAIVVSPEGPVDVRITLSARLAGTYWMSTSAGRARVAIEGEPARDLARETRTYADQGARTVEITATLDGLAAWQLTFVHEATLLPTRAYLRGPPSAAPAAIRAIR